MAQRKHGGSSGIGIDIRATFLVKQLVMYSESFSTCEQRIYAKVTA